MFSSRRQTLAVARSGGPGHGTGEFQRARRRDAEHHRRTQTRCRGEPPGWLARTGFQMLDPIKTAQSRLDFLRQLHDREALLPREQQRRFLSNDGWIAWSGPAIAELLKQFIAHNRMMSGGFSIHGKLVTLSDITCPVLAVVGEVDDIGQPAVRRYISQTQAGDRFQLFEDRGISLDTNLWPDFLIDQHLASMLRKGLLGPGSVHRVAVVGPGLDFANKEMGNDFYPRQTIQPFAVLDSLVRLGLSNPASVELYTLDISSEVNFHIARARKNAAAGRAYVVQLPWNTAARMTDEYRQSFTEYWEKLGSSIGESVPPIAVPAAAAAETETRAVKIRPAVVLRITPLDTNIVIERPARAAQSGFDLIIGTNIFVYFGEFEQALARLNMALMLNPGAFALSNDRLPGSAADGLADSLETTQIFARNPDRTEYMFTYQRRR